LSTEATHHIGHGAFEQGNEIRGRERLQHVDARARKQCRIELEGRVLRRRTDEDECAVLDERQESVLLRLVEAVHFIEEQDRRPPAGASRGGCLLDSLADVLDARRHRRKRDEMRIAGARDEPGQRRLAAAGRSPQDH
jgi:hypothetical protein